MWKSMHTLKYAHIQGTALPNGEGFTADPSKRNEEFERTSWLRFIGGSQALVDSARRVTTSETMPTADTYF